MSTSDLDSTDLEDADLLPDSLSPKGSGSKTARPLVRTKKQQAAGAARLLGAEQAEKALEAQTRAQASAAQLAQIINLHIAGYSLAQIGASIGASEAEVDRMLSADMARYVRSQPALRVYVRNWISSKYTKMIEVDWKEATDVAAKDRLENQDRVMRMLDRMAKLHGAEAPVQSEITLDAAPEAVEKLVAALAASQGLAYDEGIFDVVEAEVVHDAASESALALEQASRAVEEEGPDDEF